jgi:hypothetical protein
MISVSDYPRLISVGVSILTLSLAVASSQDIVEIIAPAVKYVAM